MLENRESGGAELVEKKNCKLMLSLC